jgi:membrane-associated phospholipid phosphatase
MVSNLPSQLKVWTASALVCAVAVAWCFANLDVPVARLAYAHFRFLSFPSEGVGGLVLVALETTTVLMLALMRVLRGHVTPFEKTLALACLSSICAYAVNSIVLKVVFGVPTVADVLHGTPHLALFLQGSANSSFPSGHMALSAAFAGVFMRLYPRSIWPLGALLTLGAGLLVLGGWHFVSDVIAGTFAGISAGLLAAEVWRVHTSRSEK